MKIEEIYKGAENLINQLIKKESFDQGHYLSGSMDNSLTSKVIKEAKADIMQGFAIYYTQFVNEGVPAASASMKQFPFMVEYFLKRGLPFNEARGAAAATIHKWMKEGMSTQASKRFSKTGSRQNFVENAITGNESKIDEYMDNSYDFAVEEMFNNTKSGTI